MSRDKQQRRESSPSGATRSRNAREDERDFWELRLYVAGRTSRAETALSNLTRACEAHLRGRYSIAVIDLLLCPKLARADQIVALPTLVRRLPTPIKKIIGDLSSLDRVLVGLELRAPPPTLRVVR